MKGSLECEIGILTSFNQLKNMWKSKKLAVKYKMQIFDSTVMPKQKKHGA